MVVAILDKSSSTARLSISTLPFFNNLLGLGMQD
jgi:hypothetical protein